MTNSDMTNAGTVRLFCFSLFSVVYKIVDAHIKQNHSFKY